MMADETTEVVRKEFSLTPEEAEKTEKLMKYAMRSGHISKLTWQDFILFSINCAYTHLKNYEVRVRKGLG